MRRFFGFTGPQDEAAFHTMVVAQKNDPSVVITTDHFTLGFCCPDNEDAWLFVDEDCCLAVSGVLHWPESLGRLPAKRLFQSYLSRGVDFLKELAGQFSLFLRDGDKFILFRSEGDGQSLYHFGGARRLVFSNQFRQLLSHPDAPRRLREEAVLEYYTFGSPVGRRTMLSRISQLQPGDWLLKRHRHQPRVNLLQTIGALSRQPEERVNWPSVFLSTVQRCVKDRLIDGHELGLAFSGGPASMLLLEALKRTGRPLTTYGLHYGSSSSAAVDFQSKKIDRSSQIVHHSFSLESVHFKDAYHRFISRCDAPPSTPDAIAFSELVDRASLEVSSLFTGFGASSTFAGHHLQRFILQHWYGTKKRLNRQEMLLLSLGFPIDFLGDALQPEFISGCKPIESIQSSALPILDDSKCQSLISKAMIANRLATDVWALLPLLDALSTHKSLQILNPFLDPRLYALSLILPSRLLFDKGIDGLMLNGDSSLLRSRVCPGFEVPLNHWISGQMHDFMISEIKGMGDGIFQKNYLLNAAHSIQSSDCPRLKRLLWMSMSLASWRKSVGV